MKWSAERLGRISGLILYEVVSRVSGLILYEVVSRVSGLILYEVVSRVSGLISYEVFTLIYILILSRRNQKKKKKKKFTLTYILIKMRGHRVINLWQSSEKMGWDIFEIFVEETQVVIADNDFSYYTFFISGFTSPLWYIVAVKMPIIKGVSSCWVLFHQLDYVAEYIMSRYCSV